MRIIVRTKDVNLWIPIPLSMAGFVISVLPEKTILELQASFPKPYGEQITKELLQFLFSECRSVIKEYKGLEILNVQASDGTFVSIKM